MSRVLAVLLLAAVLPCAIAQPPPPKPKASSLSSLSMHGLKKAISHFWDGKKGLLCADCIQLAMEIDALLYKPPRVESDDPNIAAPGPGRRMKVKHSEEEIYGALDVACDKLAESKNWGEDVLQDCQQHITDHRQALENAIFDKGTEALASAMCISLFNLCNPHNLMDSGEL